MSRTRWLLAACASLPLAAGALACGAEFPWRLLADRDATLKGTPANTFAFDAAHFVPRPEGISDAVEPSAGGYGDATNAQNMMRRPGQNDWLSFDQGASQSDAAAAAPGQTDAAEPEPRDEIGLYAAAAKAFWGKDWIAAAALFEKVLALPPDQRQERGLDAAYSLGRTRFAERKLDESEAAFALVREMTAAGTPDRVGLAAGSLGESAKVHLERARFAGADGAPDVAAAVRLYAEQASTGSTGAALSLRIVVQNWILDQDGMLERVIGDPVVQPVIVSYALTRIIDGVEPADDGGLRRGSARANPAVVRIVEAADKAGISHLAAADRLAAAAYRAGRYDIAERVAAQVPSPLSEWVLAKIAVQNGDVTSALKHYAAATRLLPSASGDLEPWMQTRLAGELATATLSQGQIAEAFDMLYGHAMEFWVDVAYVADRLLTVDELKRYVDRKVPALPPGTKVGPFDFDNPQGWRPMKPPATVLRNLLARRLVRERRIEEALPYFDRPEVRERAAAYDRALRKAATAGGRMEKAEAWYTAGTIARRSGMEIMGTEDAPDFFFFDGNFEEDDVAKSPPGPFMAKKERSLARRSAAQPDRRWHYRYIAYDHMMKAVDNLPPRSQSAAAILCRAGEWMRKTPGGDSELKKMEGGLPFFTMAWRRYQRSGANFPFASTFGFVCPEPEAFANNPVFAAPPKDDLQTPM